jgi:2-oxoglutarate ferredoxin oxidoreductase subunit gamma
MQTEIIIAGFGGQGVLFAGQILARAAVQAGHEVTWIPSYGPEMRGGTANCTVIISDEEIGAPFVRSPKAVLALNLPSLDKFEELIQPGGVLVVNSALVDRDVERQDIDLVEIPATDIAEELGDKQLANIIMVGALLERLPVLTQANIAAALETYLQKKKAHLLVANLKALKAGATFAAEKRVTA